MKGIKLYNTDEDKKNPKAKQCYAYSQQLQWNSFVFAEHSMCNLLSLCLVAC